MVKNIAVLISGSGSNLQAIIDNINTINGEIKVVISSSSKAYGLVRAHESRIDNMVISKDNDLLMKTLKDYEIDVIVLAGYLAILPSEIIKSFPCQIINIHPSLLPSFGGKGAYGLNVHKMALERGVKVSGATVHFVSEGIDEGPIILQDTCDISDLDDPLKIQERVLEIEHRILPLALQLYCDDKIIYENGRTRII